MNDWYKILEVQPSASIAEIKRAFRTKAKHLHPDIPANNRQAKINEELMRELLRAYEILSSPTLKAAFDLDWAKKHGFKTNFKRKADSFDYRAWLVERQDPESRAKLIIFDLFQNREDDAIKEYVANREKDAHFRMSAFLDREDFMDCGFILAEELVFRSFFYEALVLLFEVIQEEQKKPYFKHFFPDVMSYTREIIRTKISLHVQEDLAIDLLMQALELNFGKKDDALFFKILASSYLKLGNKNMGRMCLQEALKLDPAMVGIKDLKKQLGE